MRVLILALVVLAASSAGAPPPQPDLRRDECVLRLPGMERARVRPDVVYKQIDGAQALRFDLYTPAGKRAEKLPLVVFVNGVGGEHEGGPRQWAIYKSWARLVTTLGAAAITHDVRADQPAEDLRDLFEYVRTHSRELGTDPDNICLWACSANVRTGFPFAYNRENTGLRCAVFYYGVVDTMLVRTDLPLFVARAGLDMPAINRSIDIWMAKALRQNAPVTCVNLPNGRHAFDLVDDNDASRQIVQATLDFMRANLSRGVQRARAERWHETRALALRNAGDWAALERESRAWLNERSSDGAAHRTLADALYHQQRYAEAAGSYRRAGDLGDSQAVTWYNAACCYALAGDKTKALEMLEKAFATGRIRDVEAVRADPDLASLRDEARYRALLDSARP